MITSPIPDSLAAQQPSFRRFRINPRSSILYQGDFRTTSTGETAAVLSGGINILIEGVEAPELAKLGLSSNVGTIDIMTDRAVVWTRGVQKQGENDYVQSGEMPFEIYMEGNIILRQGDRVITADRMFFDVRQQVGVLLNAELITDIPEISGKSYEGVIRLKAAAVRQLNETQFLAQDGLITTSRLEDPSYALRSSEILIEDRQRPAVDAVTGIPLVDANGRPVIEHRGRATSKNTKITIGNVPIFYWPSIATDLENPSYYINNFRVRNDRVFGFQLGADFDALQLFGMEDVHPGTNWNLGFDWLSKRGFGFGTDVEYKNRPFFGLPGAADGTLEFWAINDTGLDNLGRGRMNLVPEKEFRGHGIWQHRHWFSEGWKLDGEIGWLSDRSFQEAYYERDWDQEKDLDTTLELKQTKDNMSTSLRGSAQINGFFTQTQWLPKLDHYWIGQEVFNTGITWFEHTSLGYANVGLASLPTDPTLAAQWKLLPWEANVEGERIVSRQEINYPVQVGHVRVVPYALGELGHWGEDLTGDDLQRSYFQTGLKASMPFWAVYPHVSDPLFNLNGLAHKVVLDAEYSFADANRNYDQFPLYDPIDDDAVEEFRRRLYFNTFGLALPGNVPLRFDARTYALRSGIQGSVTSPSMELVEDLETVRVGMRQRWQTKRGAPGQQHVVDWITLDMNATYFPQPSRDNFGEEFGLIDYDFKWHIGDRVSILSDGAADFFDSGLQTASAGVMINRPDRGNAYLGFRTIDGPFQANVLSASFAYRLTPKWIASGGTAIDFAATGNIGQMLSITRVGESLNVTVGAHVDASKNNVGFHFMLDPRFLFNSKLTRDTGLFIPPGGINDIE